MKENDHVVDITNTEHYEWGDCCEGWHFLKSETLSVIRERMPGLSKEQLHYHSKAQQFFYILSGEALFKIDGSSYIVSPGKGISIKPGIKHLILNNTVDDLEFLVISEPPSRGDRVDID